MGTVDEILAVIMPRLEETDKALHNGNAELRKAVWSHHDPVTLFGAAFTKSRWDAISPIFDWLASTFSNCDAFRYEVVTADVSGEFAYIVGIEHTTASVGGAPAAPTPCRSQPSSDERMAHGRSSTDMLIRCRIAATPRQNNCIVC
jgi:hypothetical protein